MQEIRDSFLAEISHVVGSPVTYQAWASCSPEVNNQEGLTDSQLGIQPKEMAEGPPATKKPRTATLADHDDPKWIASQKGFSVESVVYERIEGCAVKPEQLYEIVEISANVKVHIACSYGGKKPADREVALKDFLEKWAIYKGDKPSLLHVGDHRPESWAKDEVKCKLYQALATIDHRTRNCDLQFMRKPDVVITTKKYSKGELILPPYAPIQNIIGKSSPSGISLGKHYSADEKLHEYFVVPPAKPHIGKDDWMSDFGLVGFWWVTSNGPKDSDKDANMHITFETVNGMKIPVLTNRITIQPNTKLVQPHVAKITKTK